jgi:LacI family transcriptional regulator
MHNQGMAQASRKPRAGKAAPNSPSPLVAVVVDPSLPYDHELAKALPRFGYYGLRSSPVAVWSDARAAAFSRSISAAGQQAAVLVPRHDSTRWERLQAELAAWLASLPKPVGIMACDDVRARHVLEACRSLGLRVPHDVAVIGVVARRSTDTLAVEDPAVAHVIRTIRERAWGPLAIADLVAESGLSRWQVEERFRRLVGRSIRDDILEVRLAEARRLVTTTDLPLKTVTPRAGFRSIAYMTTVFRRHFGTTPAALRAAARGGQ